MSQGGRYLVIAVSLAAIALGAVMEGLGWLDTFSGELCVGTGREECVAVRLPGSGRVPLGLGRTPVMRDLAVEAIPFKAPEISANNLDDSQKYDAIKLPFSIRLNRAVALGGGESHDELHIGEPGGDRSVEIAQGETVDLDGVPYKVDAIRPWAGLMRESGGTPMALIALRKGGEPWTEGIFLMSESWRRVEPSIGLRFRWAGSEEAANEALDAGLPGVESARWGIADGSSMNWFETFEPNAGATLANGTVVHLLRMDEQHAGPSGPAPAIEVQWNEAGRVRTEWIAANTAGSEAPVRFEYPARLDTVMLINVISEQRALVAIYEHGKLLGREPVMAGSAWRPEGATFEIRFDQAMERAVPVPIAETHLCEAVLAAPAGTLRIREGESVRQGDLLLQFVRHARLPDVKYELAAVNGGGKRERVFTLGPGDTVRHGDCRFSLAPPCAEPLRMAALHVEYAPARVWPRLLLACALALLIWVAMHPRKPVQAVDVRSVRTP